MSIDENKKQFEVTTEERSLELDQSPDGCQTKKESKFHKYAGVLTGGAALMSDGYQQGVMTMTNVLLGQVLGSSYSTSYKTMVSNSMLVANIIGQVILGFVCDRWGRKQAFIFTTLFIIAGSIVCACAQGSSVDKLLWMLIIGRGIAGFGVGGEYPCAGTSAMETANEKLDHNKRIIPFICATNLPISLGVPVSTIVFLIVQAIWKDNYNGTWRTLFAIGAFIPLSIFYFRWRLDHSQSYKENAIKKKVPYVLVMKKYWKPFAGTAGMWFLMDMILYPNNIFSASILQVAIPNASVKRVGEWQLFLSSFGVFGTILAMVAFRFLHLTRRQLIISGFIMYGVISFIVGGCFEKFTEIPALLIIFYALLSLVLNFGPGSFQSVVSTESFPTAIRGTLYGISAGIGKAGAAIGTEIFTPIQVHTGKRNTFFLSGGLALLGAVVVWWGVPDNGYRSLDELDVEFSEYLKEQGWEGQVGESKEDQEKKYFL